MPGFLQRHPFFRGTALLVRRYFDHHVGRDSAALTYYLLFALFPLLILLNNAVGLLNFDVDALLTTLSGFIPRDALDFVAQYLRYVSRVSSRMMLWFSLIFTIYFPYRAVNALFQSVRKAYEAGPPTGFLRSQLRMLLYTMLLIIAMPLSLAMSSVSRSVLEFVSRYVYLNESAIRVWDWFRFVVLAAILFSMIALLYLLALDLHSLKKGILPGVIISLLAWIGLSMLFSIYVEHAANYSLIYGSIGTIIVLLLWLYLSATTLIMGAEFNSVLLDIRISRGKST